MLVKNNYFTIQTGLAQLCIQPSLDDGKKVLFVWIFIGCYAAIQPANGSVHCLLHPRSGHGTADHVIQLHHNVWPWKKTEKHGHGLSATAKLRGNSNLYYLLLMQISLIVADPDCSVCWLTSRDLGGSLCHHMGTWTLLLPQWPPRVQQETPSETLRCP